MTSVNEKNPSDLLLYRFLKRAITGARFQDTLGLYVISALFFGLAGGVMAWFRMAHPLAASPYCAALAGGIEYGLLWWLSKGQQRSRNDDGSSRGQSITRLDAQNSLADRSALHPFGYAKEGTMMANSTRADIQPIKIEQLSWEPDKVLDSLATLFNYVVDDVNGAISWYLNAKKPNKRWALLLRLGAIFATAFAGIVPVLQQIVLNGHPPVPLLHPVANIFKAPAWASVLIAIAATFVALDRFFGYSSGWMRYMATEMKLSQVLQDYQMDWEIEKASWQGGQPTADQIQKMLARSKDCLARARALVQEETSIWIQEFSDAIKQIDAASATKPALTGLGAVNITVTNGDQCSDGWKLRVDDGNETNWTGKTATVGDLIKGLHQFKATGDIGGKTVQAASSVTVPTDSTITLQMTLN